MRYVGIQDARLKNTIVILGLLLTVFISYNSDLLARSDPVVDYQTVAFILDPKEAEPLIDRGSISTRSDRVPLPAVTPTPTPLPTPVPPDSSWQGYVIPPPTPKPTPVPTPPPAPSHVLGWPVNGGKISQYFSSSHPAVDISLNCGNVVISSDAGIVSWAGWRNNGGGYVVEVDHGWGVTGYNHLSAIYVSKGQAVAKGEAIAEVGSTGNSTGCHVHWTLVVAGLFVNPLAYLPSDQVIMEGEPLIHDPIQAVMANG